MKRDQRHIVLFITYGFATGGAETMLVNLLNTLDRCLIRPLVVSLSRPGSLESKLAPEIEVRHFPRTWKFDLLPARQITDVIKREGVETVFALGMFSHFYTHLATKKLKRPIRKFISVHSTIPRSRKEYLQNMIYARLLDDHCKIICVCNNQADYLSKKHGIERKLFETIYNGVDTAHYTLPPEDFDRMAFRRGLNIPQDVPIILQVAAFRKEKKQTDSIRALRILHDDRRMKPYLVFVGGGDETLISQTKALGDALGVDGFVRFCGLQNDPRPYYWTADVFTLSSVETFSIAALEAMACGLPCVLTDQGGAREMIQEGVNGFVVRSSSPEELARAWGRCLNGEVTASSIQVREHVLANFTLQQCVQAYEELLTST